ncbi:hypothetical protein [Anaerovibrio lipolyticus]|uniref:hypothetical protein n=1 Tax=Anaerovibrio lipolyticus TaxID=82374 RepID=UPI0004858538|nr:hypothetical protein [Anaerovibrio lipolyticus]
MNKKTIVAGIMSIMMLSTVPAFAATSHPHDNTPAHHISTEAQHIDHDKKEVKPPKDKEPKPLLESAEISHSGSVKIHQF